MTRLLWILLGLPLAAAFAQEAPTVPARPNVVLVMADDLGWGDTGYNGHPILETPHLDAMSRQGVRFERFYSASAVCSPTRGSCLTGRHPDRYGIPTANRGHLRASEITLAEILSERGYATGHFGKWHLGTMSPDYSGKGASRKPAENYCTPGMSGFEEWFSTEFAVGTWDPYARESSHLGKNIPWDPRALYWENGVNIEQPLTGCDSRIIMDRALRFIGRETTKNRPFLAVVWFHAPHTPVIGGPEYRKLYSDRSEDEQHYFATVTALDAQVGRLRAFLRERELADDTLVWFCSDNGPEGNPGPQKRNRGSAGLLRGRKRSLYEGGIRVPGLLEWPGRIPKPRKLSTPAVTSDILPTVLAALGLEPPADRPLDGVDLMPMIDGEQAERGSPIAFRFGKQAALIGDRYKLITNESLERQRSDNGAETVAEVELYDLHEDPSETKNLAAEQTTRVKEMRASLEAWRAE